MKKNKKQDILEAAKDILLKKGIFETRVEDITNYLGIAKGSFYTYFKTKNELLNEIISQFFEIRKKELENIAKNNDDLESKIRNFILFSNDLKSSLIIINLRRNYDSLNVEIRDNLLEIEKLNRSILKDILEKYTNSKYVKDSIEIIILFILGGIKSYRMEKLFYKNLEDFLISDINELEEKMRSKELENDIKVITNTIKAILGGEK